MTSFRVRYADGTLAQKLPAEGRRALRRLGVLAGSARKLLRGRVVFPLVAAGGANSGHWWDFTRAALKGEGICICQASGAASRVTVSVADKNQFLEVAARNGYDVNRYYEVFSDHQNDSARQITRTSFEPGMHFANDDPSNLNKFYVHWDRRSTAFRQGSDQYWTTWGEQSEAASTHNNPYTPSQLRQELKKNGTVPRGEP